jgi:hypothetical protein
MKEETFQQHAVSLTLELKDKDPEFIEKSLKKVVSLFSFNDYKRLLTFLRNERVITPEEHQLIWKDYAASNKNLIVYGIGSKMFGEIWAVQHLLNLEKRFQKPDRSMDPEYIGQYDLWLDGVKLGTKACRAIDLQQEGDRFAKALRSDSIMPFELNFRQLRIESCDCFVLIGVWLDKLVYWVLSYLEMKENKFLFMGEGEGSVLKVTSKNISDFDKYITSETNLVTTLLNKKT